MKRKKLEPLLIMRWALEDSAAGADYRREVLTWLPPHLKRVRRSLAFPTRKMGWDTLGFVLITPIICFNNTSHDPLTMAGYILEVILAAIALYITCIYIGYSGETYRVKRWLRDNDFIERLPALLLSEEMARMSQKERRQLWSAGEFGISPGLGAYSRIIVSIYDALHPFTSFDGTMWLELGLLLPIIAVGIVAYFYPALLSTPVVLLVFIPVICGMMLMLRKFTILRLCAKELAAAVDEYNAAHQPSEQH